MEEWKEYKLGDLIALNSGGTPDKNNKSYWEGNIPWISAKYMYDDYLYSSELKISQEGLANGSRLAPTGSILLLTRGSGLFNRIPICYTMRDLAYNQDVKCIESSDKELVSTEFLFYWLMGNKDSISAIIETTGIGAGKIDTNRLKNIRISLPSKKYQQALIDFSKSLMHKIEVNRQINDNFYFAFFEVMLIWLLTSLENDNLEQQAQALFKSWFVDFEPFKDGEFKETEQGMIPKGWKASSLEDITVQKSERVGDRDDVKVLSPVTTGELMLSEEYFTKQVFSESIAKYKVVESGDFAYNPARVNIGSLGRNNYDFDGCVSPVYVVFSCKDGYAHLFDLYRKTEKFKTEVNLRAIGGVRQSLNYKDFAFIQCIVPPYRVVEEFNAMYEHLLVMQKHTQEESERLASLRDTLLPRLMSGELKVNEIEKVI